MANKVTIKLNSEGVRSLLRSGDVLAVCEKYANQAVSRLGSGYEVSTYVGPKRVNASVAAVSDSAKKDNLDNNSLLKAVGAND